MQIVRGKLFHRKAPEEAMFCFGKNKIKSETRITARILINVCVLINKHSFEPFMCLNLCLF